MPEAAPNRGVMIVLAYLWPLALVPLLLEKHDPDVRWHARHGLVLMAAEILIFVAFAAVTSVVSLSRLGVGCALSLFVIGIWIAILAVHITAIVKGLGGSRLTVPYVSQYADRF